MYMYLLMYSVLAHFNHTFPTKLAADASAYGIGSFAHGNERPIEFASHSSSSNEMNYTQLEREKLALVYGLKKFH